MSPGALQKRSDLDSAAVLQDGAALGQLSRSIEGVGLHVDISADDVSAFHARTVNDVVRADETPFALQSVAGIEHPAPLAPEWSGGTASNERTASSEIACDGHR
jgi:hypothetical protein